MRALVVASAVIVASWASAARADEEGCACEISADCGELHCIDHVCAVLEDGKVRRHSQAPQPSWMFGDGHGYVVPIITGDIVASALTGALIAITLAGGSGWFTVAGLFPTTLTGMIIHAANGRYAPAIISVFAWASGPPTTFGVAFLGFVSNIGDRNTPIVAGTAAGIVLATALTALDGYLARDVRTRSPSAAVMPSIVPTRGGFTASLVGGF